MSEERMKTFAVPFTKEEFEELQEYAKNKRFYYPEDLIPVFLKACEWFYKNPYKQARITQEIGWYLDSTLQLRELVDSPLLLYVKLEGADLDRLEMCQEEQRLDGSIDNPGAIFRNGFAICKWVDRLKEDLQNQINELPNFTGKNS